MFRNLTEEQKREFEQKHVETLAKLSGKKMVEKAKEIIKKKKEEKKAESN